MHLRRIILTGLLPICSCVIISFFRALEDIKESIKELKYYKNRIFR